MLVPCRVMEGSFKILPVGDSITFDAYMLGAIWRDFPPKRRALFGY